MRRRLELGLLFLALAIALCWAAAHAGVCWDEVSYFDFSDYVRDWWRQGASISTESVQAAWAYNAYLNPHPPLMRALSAMTSTLSALPFPANYRLATVLLCAALLTFAAALVRTQLQRTGALLLVAAVVFQPRVFGDMLNATTDAPVALSFLVLTLLGWRLAEAPADSRAALRVGLFSIYALATAVKFTGFLAIIPVGAYLLFRRQWKDVFFCALAVPMALAFLTLTSPEAWHRPLAAMVQYVTYPFTRSSIPIATHYLGKTYGFELPWHYFDVMTAVTLPLPVLFALPFAPLAWSRHRALLTALLFSLGFWVLLVHAPNTPRHDGVRQFLSVMPLLGAVATLSYESLFERAHRWKTGLVAATVLALAASFAPWVDYPLSSYNEFVGGLKGAERRGFEMSYFLEAITPPFLSEVNEALAPGDTVMLAPPWPGLLQRYQHEGMLRADIKVLDGDKERVLPSHLLMVRRRGMVVDAVYERLPALLEVTLDDVSLAKFSRLHP